MCEKEKWKRGNISLAQHFPFFPFSLFFLISHMDNETESISLFELWLLNSYYLYNINIIFNINIYIYIYI